MFTILQSGIGPLSQTQVLIHLVVLVFILFMSLGGGKVR